ncbi:branched-chain amino acid ABC transporter permease [Mesorhizobium sp. ASY16-5R]|uniref:branched-chain amino acid ABC transporter permease n=1 Tax=Mesorhizobium sp. ASY16-5R TaxID=3445772 RepID=UPI003FA14674
MMALSSPRLLVSAALGLAAVALIAGATLSGDRVLLQTIVEAEIRLILVISLFIFTGNSGVVSFVHVGLMMVGAYVAAWLTVDPVMKDLFLKGLPWFLAQSSSGPVLAIALGSGAATILAFASGLVICRLSGIGASIASFALFMALFTLFRQASGWTAGQSSLVGNPVRLDAATGLGGVALALIAAWLHGRSRWGIRLRASREDEVAARSCGIDVIRNRLLAFTLSGAVAGLAGGIYSQFLGMLTVDMFYLDTTFIALAMLMIGGAASLQGAVIGSAAVSIAIFAFKRMEKGFDLGGLDIALAPGMAEVTLGIAMIAILVLRPRGIISRAG